MLIRVIVLLLVTLNLAAAAWIVSTYRIPPAPVTASANDGVASLILLSELDGVKPAPEVAALPALGPGQEACMSVGPFSNQADLRIAMGSLTPLTRRIQYREAKLAQSRGWWVYLPSFPTRELALEAARELSQRGVKDYYVISAGDQQNTISLGLFHERSNAEHRQADLVTLGLNPLLGERTEESPVYWIDFAQAKDAPIAWRSYVSPSSSLTESRIDCF